MKLKGAIIGCGFFAHNHMQAWNEIKNIEIVAVCDLDKKKAISFSCEIGPNLLLQAGCNVSRKIVFLKVLLKNLV